MSVARSRPLTGLAGVESGYAPLDSGLLVPRSYLPQIAGLLHNTGASAAPGVGDDSADGYGVGSCWFDTTNDIAYTCLDASVGAAAWVIIGQNAWTTYTPTLTAVTTNPTVGNGTLAGRWRYLGNKTVAITIQWRFGSTSAAGSGDYSFALPFTSGPRGQALAGYLLDTGAALFVVAAYVPSGNSIVNRVVVADAAGDRQLDHAAPITWANGDELALSGVLEIA